MADKFPESLPGFQKMFLNDAACAVYLESTPGRRDRVDLQLGEGDQ